MGLNNPGGTGNITVDSFSGDGSTVAFTLTATPGTLNNTYVFISGVYQFKSTYSVSGTTLTFGTAPPTGTSNIQVLSVTTLNIGTPADGTVTRIKLAAGAVGTSFVSSKTTTYAALTTDDVILCSGSAFTVTLPAASTQGRILTIKKTDSSLTNVITIARTGSDTITDNTSGLTSTTLNTISETIVLVSDGISTWQVISRTYPSITSNALVITSGSGFGTVTVSSIFSWRQGDRLYFRGSFKTGTTTGAEAVFALPVTIDSAKISATSGLQSVGKWTQPTSGLNIIPSSNISGDIFCDGLDMANVYLAANVQTVGYIKPAVNSIWNSGAGCSFEFSIPVSGWKG